MNFSRFQSATHMPISTVNFVDIILTDVVARLVSSAQISCSHKLLLPSNGNSYTIRSSKDSVLMTMMMLKKCKTRKQ